MKLHVYSYNLKTKLDLIVRDQSLNERRGHVLILADGDSILGLGEVSPLPFWSRESPAEALAELDWVFTSPEAIKSLTTRGFFSELKWQKLQARLSPSVSWSLYSTFRSSPANWTNTRVNALITLDSNENVVDTVVKLENRGYTTIKIKVSQKHIEFQADLLREIIKNTERIRIRLDANQSLNQKQTMTLLKDQSLHRFEYFEEPLQPSEDRFALLRQIQDEHQLAFALDETLIQLNSIQFEKDFINLNEKLNKLKLECCFIAKPMLLGANISLILKHAKKYRRKLIVSSTYESPVGLFSNSQLIPNASDIDMGLDLTPFDLDWSQYVEQNGAHIRMTKANVILFCKTLKEVCSYELG